MTDQTNEHELFIELTTAITAELESRQVDYMDKNPCHRFSDLYQKEYCISGEDLEEEAEEDSIQTFLSDLDDKFPKLYEPIVNILKATGYSI